MKSAFPHQRIGWWAVGMAVVAWIWTARPCLAHADSEASIDVRLDGGRLSIVWQGALRDLDHAIRLDVDGDGRVTRGEWEARASEATRFVRTHLRWRHGGRLIHLTPGEWSHPEGWQGREARLALTAEVPAVADGDRLEYDIFFEGDPWHRAQLFWTRDDTSVRRALLSPDQRWWSPEMPVRSTRQAPGSRGSARWPVVCAATLLIGFLVWRLC